MLNSIGLFSREVGSLESGMRMELMHCAIMIWWYLTGSWREACGIVFVGI